MTFYILGADKSDSDLRWTGTGFERRVARHVWVPVAAPIVAQFNVVTFIEEHANGNSGANATIDWNNGNKQSIVLTNDCTLVFTGTIATGPGNFQLKVTQDGTGGWEITWPTGTRATGGVAPTLTGTAASVDIIAVEWDGAAYHVGVALPDSQVIT